MARYRATTASWIVIGAMCWAAPNAAWAQSRIPTMNAAPPEAVQEYDGTLPTAFESAVSFIDCALPRSTIRFWFDVNKSNIRPTRAEYLYPGDGFAVPETRVDTQELYLQAEYGLNEWFSTFMSTPYKWINPEQNRNLSGLGDLHFGAKFAGWNSESLLTAFQLRFGAHTAQHTLTGTGHWSIEPSFLVNWRLMSSLTLEGQVGYWVPLGGTNFAGDILKYGLGLSLGGRSDSAIQLVPVAEIVGWTITSGNELVELPSGGFATESSAGHTILNGCLGLRFTLGQNADIYTGYSRCFTDNRWYRDTIRLEFRLFY